jgi:predicted aconitase with swiveling domain
VRVLTPGSARGEVVRLDDGLSFWGGFDPETGTVIDRSHPQFGVSLAGKILVMPHGRGSSSSSSVLAEALRMGTGPSAIVLAEPDQILVVGALVAGLLYDVQCPILVGDPAEWPEGYAELGEV